MAARGNPTRWNREAVRWTEAAVSLNAIFFFVSSTKTWLENDHIGIRNKLQLFGIRNKLQLFSVLRLQYEAGDGVGAGGRGVGGYMLCVLPKVGIPTADDLYRKQPGFVTQYSYI